MRLRYDTSISADPAPLALSGPDDTRVEIHIRRDPDGTATLLAFSGSERAGPATRNREQGPFQHYDQAVAARRAIAAQLRDQGFALAEQQHPRWSMEAQRAVNAARKRKAASTASYDFDPKDVFLDW